MLRAQRGSRSWGQRMGGAPRLEVIDVRYTLWLDSEARLEVLDHLLEVGVEFPVDNDCDGNGANDHLARELDLDVLGVKGDVRRLERVAARAGEVDRLLQLHTRGHLQGETEQAGQC